MSRKNPKRTFTLLNLLIHRCTFFERIFPHCTPEKR
nr:MAG TPA: hypothetical protein [Caudoviricetes sp.]